MSNRANALLVPKLRADSGTSLKRQLYVSIREAVLDGTVEPGMRLPSTRMLARKLHVLRTTVVEVFEQLLADGVTFGRPGAGTTPSQIIAGVSVLETCIINARCR